MAMTKCKECGNEISNKAEACPKCGAKVKKSSLLLKIGGGFLAIVVLAAVFSPDKKTNSSVQQASADVPAQTSAPVFKTTAKEIASAYNENSVAADSKFKGKQFEVAGNISAINTDFMNNAVVLLKGGVNEFMEPQFQLSDADKPKAASLKKGMSIVLICEGAGDIAKTPMMKDCSIK